MKISTLQKWGFYLLMGLIFVNSDCGGDDNGNDMGMDMEPPPELSLGIFSETAPENLEPDVDSFIGTFSGNGASVDEFTTDTNEIKDGSISLKTTISVDASRGGFAGWFVSWGDASKVADNSFTRDMSDFSGGKLIFWVKSPINIEVGIRSGNVGPGDETSKVLLSEFDAFEPDDTWRQICIPLSMFEGSSPKADLSKIKVFFVIASNTPSGGTGDVPQTFWIDDVRWESTSCP